MASVVYNQAMKDSINWSSDDVRGILCMTNTTAGSDIDVDVVSGISVLDEADATGYVRKTLTDLSETVDDATDKIVYDASDVVYSGLSGDATRNYQGVLLYKHVTDDTDSIPLYFMQFTSGVSSAATQLTVQWNGSGIFNKQQG